MRCSILIPSYERMLSRQDTHGCLNIGSHLDSHIHRLSDGSYVTWEDDSRYNEDEEEDDEAIAWNYIKTNKALALLNASYDNKIPKEVKKIIEEE